MRDARASASEARARAKKPEKLRFFFVSHGPYGMKRGMGLGPVGRFVGRLVHGARCAFCKNAMKLHHATLVNYFFGARSSEKSKQICRNSDAKMKHERMRSLRVYITLLTLTPHSFMLLVCPQAIGKNMRSCLIKT